MDWVALVSTGIMAAPKWTARVVADGAMLTA